MCIGCGYLLACARAAPAGLQNIRVINHDATEVLQHMIASESVDAFHIFFPDPWPKSRHHKRRLVTPAIARILAQRLRPGGELHVRAMAIDVVC